MTIFGTRRRNCPTFESKSTSAHRIPATSFRLEPLSINSLTSGPKRPCDSVAWLRPAISLFGAGLQYRGSPVRTLPLLPRTARRRAWVPKITRSREFGRRNRSGSEPADKGACRVDNDSYHRRSVESLDAGALHMWLLRVRPRPRYIGRAVASAVCLTAARRWLPRVCPGDAWRPSGEIRPWPDNG